MPEEKTLSQREEQILQLVATGMTNREIAQTLSISPNTVKVHLSNIFEKIGAASRTEATLYGIEHGIVDVPGNGSGGEPAEPTQTGFWQLVRQYYWIWVPLLLLAGVFLATFGRELFSPSPTPSPQALTEMAERWQALAPMPEPRSGMAAVAYGGQVYALAGEGPGGVSGLVFRYDPEDDSWENLRDKPTPVRDVKAALIGEKIYVPGGLLEGGQPTDILEVYDPRQDTWETAAPLPQAVSAYALADFEGQLYLFGGWDGEGALDQVYVYDPTSDVWREGTPMPTPRYYTGAAASVDRIIVLGGRSGDAALADVQAYYPSRDESGDTPWETFEAMPEPRYNFGVASVYDTIYLVGGMTDTSSPQGQAGIFLTEEGWGTLPTMQDYVNRPVTMVSLGSLLVMIDSDPSLAETRTWQYQAFYYSIYIPFVQ